MKTKTALLDQCIFVSSFQEFVPNFKNRDPATISINHFYVDVNLLINYPENIWSFDKEKG